MAKFSTTEMVVGATFSMKEKQRKRSLNPNAKKYHRGPARTPSAGQIRQALAKQVAKKEA